jgi:hypothetical protein
VSDEGSIVTEKELETVLRLTRPQANEVHGVGTVIPAQTYESYPNGFFHSFTTSGRRCGVGFFCHKCKVLKVAGVAAGIFHCGGMDLLVPDEVTQSHKLGSRLRYPTETPERMALLAAIKTEITDARIEQLKTDAMVSAMLEPRPSIVDRVLSFLRKRLTAE